MSKELKPFLAPGHSLTCDNTSPQPRGSRGRRPFILVFLLEARPSGTLLRFTHAGWQAETDYFTSCNTAWGELMFRLKAAAEGKPRGLLFLAADLAY
jgi:hypothetical protein